MSTNRRRVVMHVDGEEPFMAELVEAPDPSSPYVQIYSPTKPGGGNVEWATRGTISYLFSWSHIKFIELAPGEGAEDAGPFPPTFR